MKATMAKDKKGKEGASRAHQRWSPPVAEDIHPGDTLQFYSPESSFEFRVLSLQHGGEWIFGTPMNDPELKHGGPLAVKRSDCMTPETARRVLEHLPTISVEAPTLA
jgi:hypothetical protein